MKNSVEKLSQFREYREVKTKQQIILKTIRGPSPNNTLSIQATTSPSQSCETYVDHRKPTAD
jgi:hypothetical protein